MDKTDLKVLGQVFLLSIVLIVIITLVVSCDNSHRENVLFETVHQHTYIVANGETYRTDMITNIEYHMRAYANSTIEIYLNDGTIIYLQDGGYTLKD